MHCIHKENVNNVWDSMILLDYTMQKNENIIALSCVLQYFSNNTKKRHMFCSGHDKELYEKYFVYQINKWKSLVKGFMICTK